MKPWLTAIIAAAVLALCACGDDDVDRTPQATGGTSTGGSATGAGPQGGTGGLPPPAESFAEMCARDEVIFCDPFEGSFSGDWMEDGGDVRIVNGAAVAGEGSTVLELATYEGQQSAKLIYQFANAPQIYIRFDVQYDVAYDNSGGSHGPILGGSTDPPWGMFGTAGIKPNGDDHFVLNFEPIGTVGVDGELAFYAYFVNMNPDGHGDYWGNLFMSSLDPPPTVTPGSWHCAEYGLQLNAPNDTNGTADFWVDGVHHGDFDGFQWRTIDGLQINTFALDSYNHFNNGPVPASSPNLVRYDNFVVSTMPVGCLSGS